MNSKDAVRRTQVPVWPTTNDGRPATDFHAAERIFLPAPAPNLEKITISARAETEDDQLRKDQLEVLAKNA